MTNSEPRATIVSDAHEWFQALPVADSACVCGRCGVRSPMGSLIHGGCKPHLEFRSSGFRPMEGAICPAP